MKICNIFNRFSFNVFALAAPVTFAVTYVLTIIIWEIAKLKYGLEGAEAIFAYYFLIIALSQYITLLITLWLLFKERNPEFRIKNPKILNIINNIYYRITAVLLFVTEIFFQRVGFGFFDVVQSFF